jgi:TctA family transporter
MAAGATQGLTFRIPSRRSDRVAPYRDRAFEVWRDAIWTSAAVGSAALVTTVLGVVPGAGDEIAMASAYTLTGILGHLAPQSE